MIIIESEKLLGSSVDLTESSTLTVTDQRAITIDENLVIALTDNHTEQIAAVAGESLDKFGATQPTLVEKKIGRPTALARVDCAIDPDSGKIFAYETDERPAGIGVTNAIGQIVLGHGIAKDVIAHLEEIFNTVPIVKRHPSERENDDSMVFNVEQTSEHFIKAKGRPVLVRGTPANLQHCTDLQEVAAQCSVSTISDEGKRQYRIATGHATLLLPTSQLPDGSFVVKTLQGSQAKGVAVCLTKADGKQLGGSSGSVSRAKVAGLVIKEGALLAEPFIPGVAANMPGQKQGRLIMRIFCAVSANTIKVLGGTYVARPNHIVHGSSDAIAGLVTVD